jgi:exportin-1
MCESMENKQALFHAHVYLLNISKVEDREIFKICLEYWTVFVTDLFEEEESKSKVSLILNLNNVSRSSMYKEILSSLRIVAIDKMVKPEEVLIVENEDGEIVREFVKESDTITLYKNMRELLVLLTHLDVVDTERIMSIKLYKQVDESEWSWNNLNKLCWAIGSISGAMGRNFTKH